MRAMRGLGIVVAVAWALGCSSSEFAIAPGSDVDSSTDVTVADTDTDDTADDSSRVDGGEPDSTVVPDTTIVDTFVAKDTFVGDTPVDTAVVDSIVVVSDSGTPDSGTPDSGTPDSGVVDSGTTMTDTGSVPDTGGCDKSSECATNFFCYKIGCDTRGICKALPTTGLTSYGPVCGCDGVTYWNSFQAANFSVGVKSEGPCVGAGRQTCALAGACLGISGSECIFELPDVGACSSLTPIGTCWRNPAGKLCPASGSGPSVMTCAAACTSHCEAVKNKLKFYQGPCTTM